MLMQVNGKHLRIVRQASTTTLDHSDHALLQRIDTASRQSLREQAIVAVIYNILSLQEVK